MDNQVYVVYYLSEYNNGLIFCGAFKSLEKAMEVKKKVKGTISSTTLRG
jgi:hypothetical protein